MKRFYQYCPRCNKRMTRFSQDPGRFFYFCRNCGNRLTFLIDLNAISDDWPQNILDAAVESGVVTKEGRVI